jgi:chromosomal replication initiation ATPase DnaA
MASPIKIQQAIQIASKVFSVPHEKLIGKIRKPEIVNVRTIVVYVLRTYFRDGYFSYSFPILRNYFNHNDHTSIVHYNQKAKKLIENNDIVFIGQIQKYIEALQMEGIDFVDHSKIQGPPQKL